MRQKKKWFILILACILLAGIIWLKLQDPYAINQTDKLQTMSWTHLFGTDYLGRDLFSRIMYGSVYSIGIAFLVLIGVVLISLVLGGSAGLIGGFYDSVMMTFADVFVSIPSLILALVFAGLFSNSVFTVITALVISWAGNYIRYIRNLVFNIKKEEFIVLAPLRGSFHVHTLVHHILPNLFTELSSLFVTDLGKLLLSISGLSFLGIGIQPPVPELGTILFDGKAYFFTAPWLFIFPGLFLSGIVLLTQTASQYMNKHWRKTND